MKILRPFNIFTCLMVVLSVGFALRLANLAAFPGRPAAMTTAANAVETVDEEPPPLTQTEIDSALKAATEKAGAAAKAAAAAQEPASAAKEKAAAPTAAPAKSQPELQRAFSASEIEVLQSLAKRRDDLERRERRLVEREALLDAAGQEVDHKIAELNKLKGEILNLLGQQQKMEEERIVSLVKIYEGMKPKEAATIFNTLDMDVLLPVISRMNERKSSPILASMDPEKARIVTIRLAQQRELPPKGQKAALEAEAP